MHHLKKLISNHTSTSGRFMNRKNLKKIFDLNSLTTSQVITFIGSFMIGLGDSSLNTQVIYMR
jgi:hypothetical protein